MLVVVVTVVLHLLVALVLVLVLASSDSSRISDVWKLFKKNSDKVSSLCCSICQKELSFHRGTSSMKEHLKCMHPDEDHFVKGMSPKQRKLDVFTQEGTYVCPSELQILVT